MWTTLDYEMGIRQCTALNYEMGIRQRKWDHEGNPDTGAVFKRLW